MIRSQTQTDEFRNSSRIDLRLKFVVRMYFCERAFYGEELVKHSKQSLKLRRRRHKIIIEICETST